MTWRFTPTGPEGMHLDNYGNDTDQQYARLLINLDEQPRLWRVSERLDVLVERYYQSAGLAELRGQSANEICRGQLSGARG